MGSVECGVWSVLVCLCFVWTAVAENMDHFEALPHLIGVATMVDFGSILRLVYQVAIG